MQRRFERRITAALALLFASTLALTACSTHGQSFAPVPGSAYSSPYRSVLSRIGGIKSSKYIKHVVIIIQENRTFDDFFATFPGADGTTTGKLHNGKTITLKKVPLAGVQLSNGWSAFATAYDGGKMDGFDLDTWGGPGKAGTRPYTYVDPNQIKPYWTIAQQYALGDHMFQGEGSGSFTAHQELIAGGEQVDSAHALVNWPAPPKPEPYAWGCDAPTGTLTSLITQANQFESKKGPFPCLTYATLADQLDQKKISWRYYSGALKIGGAGYMWNAFEAIKAIRYGNDWTTDISTPSTAIFQDISHGKLADVTWLTPSVPDSDHEYNGPDHGPAWIAQVVNAIGQSSYWDSTAIVIVWDDWGGHYDHVAPQQFGYGELGFRVPLLVVSPYIHAGTISQTPYEFGSVLKFVEDNWGLKPMQAGDQRATSIGDVFDFTQSPRSFTPIPANLPRSFFEHEPPSDLPGDGE
jgi:phospholipase C